MSEQKRRTLKHYSPDYLDNIRSLFSEKWRRPRWFSDFRHLPEVLEIPIFELVERSERKGSIFHQLEEHKYLDTKESVKALKSFHLREKYGFKDEVTAYQFKSKIIMALPELKVKRKITPDELLRAVEREARLRLKTSLGRYYFKSEYRFDNIKKIRETIIDLAWTAILYSISMNDFYDSLTPIVVLNELVYRTDNAVESIVSNSHGLVNSTDYGLNDLAFESKMLFSVKKFLNDIGRPDLEKNISYILVPIRANALREAFAFSQKPWMKEYVSFVFKDFLEPSDKEYGDIGFYCDLFVDMNKKQINKERNKVKLILNARSRTMDIADHVIDEKDDVIKRIPSIMTLYTYDRAKYSEREVIKNTICSGNWNEKFEKIVGKYALDLLSRIKEYVDDIKPRYRKTKALQERTYKIIELTRNMVIDSEAIKDYELFYAKPLKWS